MDEWQASFFYMLNTTGRNREVAMPDARRLFAPKGRRRHLEEEGEEEEEKKESVIISALMRQVGF